MSANGPLDKFCLHRQAKLEKLLQIYPQEEVESKRWEKIAAALGNRTYKQVCSLFLFALCNSHGRVSSTVWLICSAVIEFAVVSVKPYSYLSQFMAVISMDLTFHDSD